MHDFEAYKKFKKHRKWFNKLWVAEKFGHLCGPAGMDIPKDGTYIIRPIYNLEGMGVGAEVKDLKEGDHSTPPGYFWCEYFIGAHLSVDYVFNYDAMTGGSWIGVSSYEGYNTKNNLIQFKSWNKNYLMPELSREWQELRDVKEINIEYIGNKIIEVHLRHGNPFRNVYDELIPVWASDLGVKKQLYEETYEWKEDYENCDGLLDDPRIGFFVKKS